MANQREPFKICFNQALNDATLCDHLSAARSLGIRMNNSTIAFNRENTMQVTNNPKIKGSAKSSRATAT